MNWNDASHKSVAGAARSGQVFAGFGRRVIGGDRDGVFAFAIRERSLDLLDQLAGGLRTELNGDPLASTVGLVDKIDAERMVERRVGRMVVIHMGGVDAHPPL